MTTSAVPFLTRRTRRRATGLLTVATLAAGALLVPASATTSITPSEEGEPRLVRTSSVDISIDHGAQTFYRSGSTGTFAAQSPAAVALGLTACRGDIPGGTNNSPRDHVEVTGPDGNPVVAATSPVRDLGASGFLTTPPHQPAVPQPAPAASNYRGDFPGSTFHGFSVTVDLTGRPAGLYTVTTTSTNMVKTGAFGACAVGTPTAAGTAFVAGPVTETHTFEYRPWQADFVDILAKGKVHANLTPAEFGYSVGAKTSPAYPGDGVQSFYGLGAATFLLPSDPAACAEDPASCLPADATLCDPGTGCTPRIMVINKSATPEDSGVLQGVFDLQTRAFIAAAHIDGSTRLLMSVGTANDAVYQNLLGHLDAAAAAQGVDLASILATEVSVASGNGRTSLSLLNGLQIDPDSGPAGVRLTTDATVQAGVILNIHSSLRLTGGACEANAASSSDESARYRRNEDNGYTVTHSDLLPDVPSPGALGALVGGPIFHIRGKFTGATAPLLSTSAAVIGVDTANDEPNGYPVWVSPFVSPINTISPRTMDFIGTGTWSASETPIATGCLVVDFLLGTGVAVYNNPAGDALATLLDPVMRPTPGVAANLVDLIDEAVQQVVTDVTSDPTVDALLGEIMGLLPPLT
ncbi:hypothetical protein [Nocardioides sp.]|uniref:hypothetical protein n=1 Tax=Nocardioides sp. TaxID=35761 RepID=UPI002734E21E|nr:hypothetical protein [Nocardioides sp.]MDP3892021.1 hypothetical protein [Nocardioides sp.]